MDNNNEQENGSDVDGGDLFERIYLGQPLDNIPDVPFRLIIDASVLMIDEEACEGCRHLLREVVFHNNVTEIGYAAFAGCHNLERVELLEGLLRVERDAFRGCTSLREIVIPASVQLIGPYVFAGCRSLERVVFAPRTTTLELSRGIFSHCVNLQSVTLPPNLRLIPWGCFNDCILLTHLHIPESVEEIGAYVFYGSGIQATKILEEDEFIPGTILLPPKLRSIAESCFEDCKSFTNIRIPPSVEEIGVAAFSGSGLRSLTISENVNQIGVGACRDCSFLERVTFHSSNNLILSNDIFTNCPLLSVIQLYPWLWPTLFASMKGQQDFLFKFFRHYHTKIFDFETPVVHRPLQRLRRDR